MKRYVVVHLPVRIESPMPLPPENINDFLANNTPLYYDLTPNTKIKGTQLTRQALPNDYIMDENNNLIGKIENTITFQNVSDLFLGESIFSLRQPLQDQIKFNQLIKHAHKKEGDSSDLNASNMKKQNPSWVIKYVPGSTVRPVQNTLKNHEKYFYSFLQRRNGAPMQLIEYLNKKQKFNLSTLQLLTILRKIAFQYSGGPFRNIWFANGYAPQFVGEQMLNVQYYEFALNESQNCLKQLSNDQFQTLKKKFPKTFMQLDLLFLNNKIQIYKQFKDYSIFQQRLSESETFDIAQIRTEIKQQMDLFFNNLLSIVQFNENDVTDDICLINMQNIENYDNLGPKIQENEELLEEQGEDFEENEEGDYSYSESSYTD